MDWRSDVAPAQAGDSAARERLREYLTPFVHGVCLAHAPFHLSFSLVPRALDLAFASLASVDAADAGAHVMNVARRLAREQSPGRPVEQAHADPNVSTALSVVSRLRELEPTPRERFFLRTLEGIPGPELADVARLPPAELRAELERSAAMAAGWLGKSASFVGDDYLWELSGAPAPLLAQLEVQLPVLRFDPLAAPPPPASFDTAGTLQNLTAVPAAPMRPLDLSDTTAVSAEAVDPGTTPFTPVAIAAPPGPNPFEPQVRTIAATDLPAEARGSLPAPPVADAPASSKSGRQPQLAARPVPSPGTGENSSKSGKSGSGKSKGANEQSARKLNPTAAMPGPLEVTKDAPSLRDDEEPERTAAEVPPAILRMQEAAREQASKAQALGEIMNSPTMTMPLAQGLSAMKQEAVVNAETRIALSPVGPELLPPPSLPRPRVALLEGASPLFIAAACTIVAVALWGLTMLLTERQSRASWQLTQVAVAAEDLNVGDVVNIENVALRAVPEPFQGSNVVRGDALDFILGQKLATSVQTGDPLFYSQFVSVRAARPLSKRVSKKGRAISLATTAVDSVGRWARPGDTVDVVLTIRASDPTDKREKAREARSVTILQHVRILAAGRADEDRVDETLDERDREYDHVTLLLGPEEGEVLTLASALGRVTLTLRNEEDSEVDLERAFTNARTLIMGDRVRALQQKRFAIIKTIRSNAAEPGGARQRRP